MLVEDKGLGQGQGARKIRDNMEEDKGVGQLRQQQQLNNQKEEYDEGHSDKDVTTAVVTAWRRAVGSGGAGGKELPTSLSLKIHKPPL